MAVGREGLVARTGGIAGNKRKQEVELHDKKLRPYPQNLLPPVRFHLLKAPQPFQIAPLAGSQVFKHTNIWGRLHLQTITEERGG